MRASVLLALLLWAAPAAAAELPVLFVHGFCSSADTWNETLPQLSVRRYGDDVPRLFESSIGKAAVRTSISQECEDLPHRFLRSRQRLRPARGANVPTVRKAGELKVVIDAIKRFTGAPGVIVVATASAGSRHAPTFRASAQSRGATIAYANDVAAVSHGLDAEPGQRPGQSFGVPRRTSCTLADTTNLRELQPSSTSCPP